MRFLKPLFLLFIIFSTSGKLFSYEYELSVCAIFHNETRFLKDWIDFHLKMGVEHFYLYNHQNKDHFRKVLKTYEKKHIVEIIDWDFSFKNVHEWNDIQCRAYTDALNRSRGHSKWVMFIDLDEYVYSPTGQSINKILPEYEEAGAVCANWVFYGTSDIDQLNPHAPLISQLVYRGPFEADPKHHVKSIVQPEKSTHFINPHFPILKEGFRQETENREAFYGPWAPSFSANKLRINHYWTRDNKFLYEHKLKRQKKWWHHLEKNPDDLNQIFDDDIYQVYMNQGN